MCGGDGAAQLSDPHDECIRIILAPGVSVMPWQARKRRESERTSMQLSETVLVEELDHLIHSAVLRIEQQGFHVEESSASPSEVAHAQQILDEMIEGLRQLRLRRAQFA